jgi:hypothetical protein
MQSIDYIAEAQVRVHLGCREDAVKFLVQFHKMNLSDAELTVKKLEILRRIRLQKIKVLEKLCVGTAHYLLLMLTAGLAVYSFVLGGELLLVPLLKDLGEHFGDIYFAIGILTFAIAGSVGFVYASLYLFFHAWFLFICRLPAKRRIWAECSLPQRMRWEGMQPMYFSIRSKYLP